MFIAVFVKYCSGAALGMVLLTRKAAGHCEHPADYRRGRRVQRHSQK